MSRIFDVAVREDYIVKEAIETTKSNYWIPIAVGSVLIIAAIVVIIIVKKHKK